MNLVLLKIGLISAPFYELILRLFPYSVTNAPDTRIAKVAISMWLGLALGLASFFSGKIQQCHNKWLLLFIVFIPLNIHLSPRFPVILNGVHADNFWVWEPFVYILCYFIMFMGVQSISLTKENINKIFSVISWCGLVMAGYMILQWFGWDQFFIKREGEEFVQITQPLIVGSLGNSTIVSPYVAMIIPISLYLKRYWVSIALCFAVIISHSSMAIGGMIVSLIVYVMLKWKSKGIYASIIMVLLFLIVMAGMRWVAPAKYNHVKNIAISSNGRTGVWKDIIEVTKNEKLGVSKSRHPFTGTGLGSQGILISPLLKTKFKQAHNEYLEVLVTMGVFGLGLFLMAIWFMIKESFSAYLSGININELSAILSSFVCIAVVAFGTFIWQVSPHNYYTVLLCGLLSNRNLLKGELE